MLKNKNRLGFRVDDAFKRELLKVAMLNNRSLSEEVRDLLLKGLNTREV